MSNCFFKRLIALILALAAMCSISAVALADTAKYVDVPQGPDYTVWVRSGAGTSYSKRGALLHGSKVTVIGTSGDWSEIECYDPLHNKLYGSSGLGRSYIKTEFLSPTIPTDARWIARYTTRDHRLTEGWYLGAGDMQIDLNSYFSTRNGTSYSWYPLRVDGTCGAKTVQAIREFQRLEGLTVDGVAGNQTKEFLYKIVDPEDYLN